MPRLQKESGAQDALPLSLSKGRTMINLKLAAGGLALSLLALPAYATVIDFTTTNCTSAGVSCVIPQTYGDTADIDMSHRIISKATGKTIGIGLFDYHQKYGDLSGVVYGGYDTFGYTSEITLAARAGKLLSLKSFDFATFGNNTAKVPIKIFDLDGNLLNDGVYSTNSPKHSTLALNTSYLSGVVIRWGPDSYKVGVDNITYDVKSAAPEPASWAMMVIGFGGLGWTVRRQRAPRVNFA